MYVDKQTVARWQINSAIRAIFAGECPVSTHVIVMAAKVILAQYAEKMGIKLPADMLSQIKDEHAKEFIMFYKERYNFFKHSDRDAEMETDITNLQITNETETFFNYMRYHKLFGAVTEHMSHFTIYMMARYPTWFRFEAFNISGNAAVLLSLRNKSRREACDFMLGMLSADASTLRELAEVRSLSFQAEVGIPEKEKNEHGKFFSRAKPVD